MSGSTSEEVSSFFLSFLSRGLEAGQAKNEEGEEREGLY